MEPSAFWVGVYTATWNTRDRYSTYKAIVWTVASSIGCGTRVAGFDSLYSQIDDLTEKLLTKVFGSGISHFGAKESPKTSGSE